MILLATTVDETLELRLLEARHAPALYARVDSNRDHLRPWMPWLDATRSEADVRAFIEVSLRGFAEGTTLQLGLWSRGTLAGIIGLNAVSRSNLSGDVGYWLDREAQGRGLMTAACRALLGHAFGELGLHRIQIRCATGNLRSQAIPRRLGFQAEGVLRHAERHGDRFLDLVVYSMLAPDWTEIEAAPR